LSVYGTRLIVHSHETWLGTHVSGCVIFHRVITSSPISAVKSGRSCGSSSDVGKVEEVSTDPSPDGLGFLSGGLLAYKAKTARATEVNFPLCLAGWLFISTNLKSKGRCEGFVVHLEQSSGQRR
jgi:hypothetical protein